MDKADTLKHAFIVKIDNYLKFNYTTSTAIDHNCSEASLASIAIF